MNINQLYQNSKLLRKDVLQMIYHAGSGHPGGSLSAADIVNALYFDELNCNPQNPDWEDRDFFILSKGHSCPVVYAALARKGYFPTEWYKRLRHINGELQGHPDRKKTPGIEFNSGSLSQGISFAVGKALALKHQKMQNRVYALLGCGEQNEGQVWEAALFAAHFKLDNVVAIIDYNKLQSDNYNSEIMNLESITDKWSAFNWNVFEIDGHDYSQILDAFKKARESKNGLPSVIIAHTIKGKGVSFMENVPKWHGSLAPSSEELALALNEIEDS